MDYHELYAKENCTVQLPLFYFGKRRAEKMITAWKDEEKEYQIKCICEYGVPGSFEQDVYTATMRIWIKQGMPKGVIFNYSDIARELNLNPPKDYVKQIREAMKRLAMARYEFSQCFISRKCNESENIDFAYFSLYSEASLFAFASNNENQKNKRNSKNVVYFPQELQNNLENKYYQLLDMNWYRALPEGLSRRLYEYLEKRRYHNINKEFTISEETLCRWLPIKTKNTTERRKTLTNIIQPLIEKGYLKAYRFDTIRKHCIFTYTSKYAIPVKNEPQENTKEKTRSIAMLEDVVNPKETMQETIQPQEQQKYLEALNWLDSIPHFHKARKKEIASLPFSHVVKYYPGIKAAYEKQVQEGTLPKVGWVYKAFMDGWTFSQGVAKKPETPEQKLERCLDEAWNTFTQEEQENYMKEYLEWIKPMDLDGSLSKNKWIFRHRFLRPDFEEKGLIPKMKVGR